MAAPLTTKELLWTLCCPSELRREGGYYLTVFESALAFVTEFEPAPGGGGA